MKTIIRNFASIFRKFTTANVLNLLGLSLAFASFFVIMAQVNYDMGYNKSIREHEKLFRLTLELGHGMEDYGATLPRPLVEQLAAASPHITGYSIGQGWINFDQFVVDNQEYSLNLMYGIHDFASAFKPAVVSGDLKGLDQENNIVLTRSDAERIFGTAEAAGQSMKYKWNDGVYHVCAVIEDYPENNFLHGVCLIGTNANEGNYNNWNYNAYIRLDDVPKVPTVQKALRQKVIELFKEDFNLTKPEEAAAIKVNLIPVADTHFTKALDKVSPDSKAVSRSSVYLLICFSLLIVLIAAVNFMNFTLAETPMRIRSINTQKVLGATTASLRGSLLAEAVIISLIAFAVALLLVYVAHDLGLQQLVQGSILLQDNLPLLGLTLLISIAVGLLAGAYPSYYVTSFPPALVLKGSFGLSPKGRVLRTILICLQFIVAFMLVIGVGIMYQQSYFIFHTDYGFDKDEVLVVPTAPDTRNHADAIDADLRQMPGIEGASLAQSVLGSSDRYQTWGRGEGDKHMTFTCLFVDWRFLQVMGIDIVEGTAPAAMSSRSSRAPPPPMMVASMKPTSLDSEKALEAVVIGARHVHPGTVRHQQGELHRHRRQNLFDPVALDDDGVADAQKLLGIEHQAELIQAVSRLVDAVHAVDKDAVPEGFDEDDLLHCQMQAIAVFVPDCKVAGKLIVLKYDQLRLVVQFKSSAEQRLGHSLLPLLTDCNSYLHFRPPLHAHHSHGTRKSQALRHSLQTDGAQLSKKLSSGFQGSGVLA